MKNKPTQTNGIKEFISSLEKNAMVFNPSALFYEKVQIKRKRWGQIYRNEKPATVNELTKLAEYFGAEFNHLISFNTKTYKS